MATDLVMPTLNTQQTAHYFPERPQHHRSQSYQPGPRQGVSYSGISSLSSSNSSGNSPTSPKPYQTGLGRQTRPLFIPAALRPNEFPSKPVHVPKTSLSEDSTPVGSLTKSGTGFLGFAGSAVQRLTRRTTGDSRGLDEDDDEDELDVDLFPGVTALPTKRHWKPDSVSSVCDDPTCKRAFGYFTRRHHCRRCGNIFCDFHSSSLVPLDQDANYNPRGAPSRACDHCHGEFQSWKSRTGSRASSSSSSEEAAAAAAALKPKATARPAPVAGTNLMFQPSVGFGKSPGAAASVPRDWNWSTF
ncbi:related to VPS27 - vacuolar protein sorting-associated protein [Cephalotrichum gorgonifer]|uniref:Related to VPS27 - vacuolar protein sorting-associated protein n=1 Tax=Cephalotrichum gorgonifer TaxID=2041049 RepID=A0AAE8SVI1_9PEZI|nr:related to VPS27 - vacuolar protein sorting-associated protein [Cephalotrichum gorgonifer]